MDYIDLFLIHHPYHNFMEMYEVLTDFYKQGRIRAIGVSSFLPCHLKALHEVSDVVPAVNQFEISPLNTQKELIKYCQDNGVAVEAMSTFSHFRSNEPRKEITESELIKWYSQHMKENISVFDFELTTEEMTIIDTMNQGRYLNYDPTAMTKYAPKKYR